MRARRKLVSCSHPGEKGTCHSSHNDRLSPRRAAPRRASGVPQVVAGPVFSSLQRLASFQHHWPPSGQRLIANLELESRVNHLRINELEFSNRKFSPVLTIRQGLSPRATSGSRGISLGKYTRSPNPEAPFLIGTLDISEFESTARKQATKQNSNRYKSGVFGFCPLRSAPRNSPRISIADAIRATITGSPHA